MKKLIFGIFLTIFLVSCNTLQLKENVENICDETLFMREKIFDKINELSSDIEDLIAFEQQDSNCNFINKKHLQNLELVNLEFKKFFDSFNKDPQNKYRIKYDEIERQIEGTDYENVESSTVNECLNDIQTPFYNAINYNLDLINDMQPKIRNLHDTFVNIYDDVQENKNLLEEVNKEVDNKRNLLEDLAKKNNYEPEAVVEMYKIYLIMKNKNDKNEYDGKKQYLLCLQIYFPYFEQKIENVKENINNYVYNLGDFMYDSFNYINKFGGIYFAHKNSTINTEHDEKILNTIVRLLNFENDFVGNTVIGLTLVGHSSILREEFKNPENIEYNENLSRARAYAVYNKIKPKLKIPARLTKVEGVGASEPRIEQVSEDPYSIYDRWVSFIFNGYIRFNRTKIITAEDINLEAKKPGITE